MEVNLENVIDYHKAKIDFFETVSRGEEYDDAKLTKWQDWTTVIGTDEQISRLIVEHLTTRITKTMPVFRPLTTIRWEECSILVEKCFNGKLLEIASLTDSAMELVIETTGWKLEDENNPQGAMQDNVSFRVGNRIIGHHLVDLPFPSLHEEELWQEFMMYYGFHPIYKCNNSFSKN